MRERKIISAVSKGSAGEKSCAGKEEKVKRNVEDIPPEERKYKNTSENAKSCTLEMKLRRRKQRHSSSRSTSHGHTGLSITAGSRTATARMTSRT